MTKLAKCYAAASAVILVAGGVSIAFGWNPNAGPVMQAFVLGLICGYGSCGKAR